MGISKKLETIYHSQPLSDGRVYIEIPDVGMKSMMPKP